MKTPELIKNAGRELFNEKGLMNVTLRDVASKLNKSYGNITYHYASKEILINALFEDMHRELTELQKTSKNQDLLSYFLKLPEISFEITLKYLFFTVDHNEIKRNFPVFFDRVNALNNARKTQWLGLLNQLLTDGYLKSDLDQEDLEYIMFLSACVRTAYFQATDPTAYNQQQHNQTVNRLLKPYLSDKGLSIYK